MKNEQIIIFDSKCLLCESAVKFILKHDQIGRFKFLSIHSENVRKYIHDRFIKDIPDSIILVSQDKVRVKSDAIMYIASHLDGFWKYLKYLEYIPKFIRDFLYEIIAINRIKILGKKEICFIPDDSLKDRFLD